MANVKAHNDPRVGVHSVRQLRAVLELISSVASKCGNVINSWGVEVTSGGQRTATLTSQLPMVKAHNDLRVGVHSVTVQGCTGLNEQCRKHCGNVINSWGPDVTPGGQHTAALKSQWPML